MRIQVSGDMRKLKRHARGLKASALPRAKAAGINYAARRCRTAVGRAVAQAKRLPVGQVRRKIVQWRNRRATPKRPYALISTFFRPVHAVALKPRQTRKGVRAGRHTFPRAFIAPASNKYGQGVFRRTTAKRYPLEFIEILLEPEATRIMRRVVRSDGRAWCRQEAERQLRRANAKLERRAR